jgi:hypothetical protein
LLERRGPAGEKRRTCPGAHRGQQLGGDSAGGRLDLDVASARMQVVDAGCKRQTVAGSRTERAGVPRLERTATPREVEDDLRSDEVPEVRIVGE